MKVCKIRFYPNQSQKNLINETLGCVRYVKNLYIEYNQRIHNKTGRFVTGYDFSKILNKLKKNEEEYMWISKYSSKAIKDAIMDEEKAFIRFFKEKKGYPKFKSRKRLNKESFFFIKDNIHYTSNPHIIKIPILGKIHITEYKYLPEISSITSGRVILDRGKFYVLFIYENETDNTNEYTDIKLGIDVGIKKYATIYSNDDKIIQVESFIKYDNYKRIKDKITRLQQIISNKVEINYGRYLNIFLDKYHREPTEIDKNIMKGESYKTSNIRRIKRKISRLHIKLANIRKDFICKLVYQIVARTKPKCITIENLSISDMIKIIPNEDNNHTLHKYISESGFYMFFINMQNKCKEYGVKLRVADKYFASSKICSCCGKKKKVLSLQDRIFVCDYCGYTIDRDVNAAINLCNLHKSKIAYAI